MSPWFSLLWFAAETPAAKPFDPTFLLMLGAIGVFFWLIVLRPQQKERQERQRKLEAVKKGDRIVTIGGIHGKVLEVDSARKVLSVEVAPKVAVKISLSAVHQVEARGSEKSDEAAADAGLGDDRKK